MTTEVIAKFRCLTATLIPNGPNPDEVIQNVQLLPVYGDSPENKTWSKWTPTGNLQMTITNPAVQGFFETGKEYYVNIKPA